MKFVVKYTENYHDGDIGSCRHIEIKEIEADNFKDITVYNNMNSTK